MDRCSFSVLDITKGSVERLFDGAYSLDVIEHIPPEGDDVFMGNICRSLREHAICIIGTTNITASAYASENGRQSHINLKSAETLSALMSRWFHNVFIFSMNDEVVHTGFHPMAHYLMGVGVGVKQRPD